MVQNFRKKRIISNKINIDKHKDIDGYVDKLKNVMRKKWTCWRKCMIQQTIS